MSLFLPTYIRYINNDMLSITLHLTPILPAIPHPLQPFFAFSIYMLFFRFSNDDANEIRGFLFQVNFMMLLSIIEEDRSVSFAAHSERYSKVKYDPRLAYELIELIKDDDVVTFYEDVALRSKLHDIRKEIFPDNLKKYESIFNSKAFYHYSEEIEHMIYHTCIMNHMLHRKPYILVHEKQTMT